MPDFNKDERGTRIGQEITALLMLKPTRENRERYNTLTGTKTALGLYRTIQRIIDKEPKVQSFNTFSRGRISPCNCGHPEDMAEHWDGTHAPSCDLTTSTDQVHLEYQEYIEEAAK